MEEQAQALREEEEEYLAERHAAQHPEPPFTIEAPYGGDHKVGCFNANCGNSCATHYQLMNHIKNDHTVKPSAYAGTYFLAQFHTEHNNALVQRRSNRQQSHAKASSGASEQPGENAKAEPPREAPATSEPSSPQHKWVSRL